MDGEISGEHGIYWPFSAFTYINNGGVVNVHCVEPRDSMATLYYTKKTLVHHVPGTTAVVVVLQKKRSYRRPKNFQEHEYCYKYSTVPTSTRTRTLLLVVTSLVEECFGSGRAVEYLYFYLTLWS
jgi:hypothetical protein